MSARAKAFLNHDWTKVGAIIITLLGIAITAEHRLTVSEEAIHDLRGHKDADDKRFAIVEKALEAATANSLRQSFVLDGLEKRVTALEADRKAGR